MFPSKIIQQLLNCKKAAVLTGAGISAESGISTFRDASGLWNNVDPMKVATPEAFEKDPKFVWEWYEARRRQIAEAEPNRGHEVIAWMEEFFPEATLITQNIDRLHQKAGSRNPIELHGSLWMVRCTGGCGEWEDRHELVNLPPKCPQCGALLRPGVVWFGEAMPFLPWEEARRTAKDCDVFFVIGTSALVYPAAGLPEDALMREKLVIEINPEETPLSNRATLSVRSKAGEALGSLQGELLKARPR
ncbi:MAG TPA: NAD-dependent deacylase [bacterium]|nr:NAD-dependent deacylase [bacterium]